MIDKERNLSELIVKLQNAFGSNLLYVGIQGSYLRNDATSGSDIDIMVILESLSSAELAKYRRVVETLPEPEKSCGFICGRSELSLWNSLEICHLIHTTEDRFGSLSEFVPPYSRRDIAQYIKLSAGNLYHAFCHSYVHAGKEKTVSSLSLASRSVFFILQDLIFLETENYIAGKVGLEKKLTGADFEIWKLLSGFSPEKYVETEIALDKLLAWCCDVMERAEKAV